MADSQRKTAQLFDKNSVEIYEHSNLGSTNVWAYDTTATGKTIRIPCAASTQYTLSIDSTLGNTVFRVAAIESETVPVSGQTGQIPCITLFNDGTASQATVTSSSNAKYLIIQFSSAILTDCINSLMMNAGSTALPYEPYGWVHSLRKLTTATEAVENPLYTDGTAITSYTIKGNTVQNGTPTPSNPVPVVGVGELETTGEHSGEYKIPISNGQQTTPIYLGSTQSTRQIEKITFDGSDDEGWYLERINSYGIANFGLSNAIRSLRTGGLNWLSNRFVPQSSLIAQTETEGILLNAQLACYIRIDSTTVSTLTAFKQWLSENPVDVWYVLATAETATVNEPLMKIGDYADALSNATAIPTTEGANSITVDTTVQPSEFTATWTGWHDASVKEWDGSDWN